MKKKNNIWKYMRETFSEFEVGKEYTNRYFSELVEEKIITANEDDPPTFDKIKRVSSTFTSGTITKGLTTKEKLDGRIATYKKVGDFLIKDSIRHKVIPMDIEEPEKDDMNAVDIGYSILSLIKRLENGIIERNKKIKELNEELKMFVDENGTLTLQIRKLQEKILEINNKVLCKGKNSINLGRLKEFSDLRDGLPEK